MGTPIDREKLLSLSLLGGRTRDRVEDVRRGDGTLAKATTDELGNTVTEFGDGRQGVHIRAPHIRIKATTTEER